MFEKSAFRAHIGACFTAVGIMVGASSAAQAGVIQLGFILDESGSIGSTEYTTIKNGLANAINTLVPLGSQYEISVVSFGSTAQTLVNHVLVTDSTVRSNIAAAIMADGFSGGGTNMSAAFEALSTAFLGSTETMIDSTYVNLATDGVANNPSNAVVARNTLIANTGVDNISIEAIGGGVDASFLQNDICYPGPCDTSSPYNFPAQGFYIAVANAAGYTAAIGNKLQIVTNQIPEPGTLALFGLGLAGLGFARRKRII